MNIILHSAIKTVENETKKYNVYIDKLIEDHNFRGINNGPLKITIVKKTKELFDFLQKDFKNVLEKLSKFDEITEVQSLQLLQYMCAMINATTTMKDTIHDVDNEYIYILREDLKTKFPNAKNVDDKIEMLKIAANSGEYSEYCETKYRIECLHEEFKLYNADCKKIMEGISGGIKSNLVELIYDKFLDECNKYKSIQFSRLGAIIQQAEQLEEVDKDEVLPQLPENI